MIEYIRGILDELSPTSAIVEAHGVGYELLISLNTYTALQGKREVRLFAYEVIREDAHLLYGFATKSERQLFDLLIGISGIGGQTARMVLSAFTPTEFADIIRSEDVKMIKSVKGIGPKAAQRIVVELKDKMALDFGTADATTHKTGETLTSASRERMEEAVAALTMLGFPPAAGSKVVRQIVKDQPDCPVEQIIKQALKLL